MGITSRLSKRQDILHSASYLVCSKGVSNVTLDAIAKETGISKGGLLYHFPSKDALFEAMVTDIMDRVTEGMMKRVSDDPNPRGKWCRAYIEEVFAQLDDLDQANAGLLAAISTHPDMLRPFREHYALWKDNMEHDGIHPKSAMMIRLMIDGLKFNAVFGMPALQERDKNTLLEALLFLTSGDGEVHKDDER